MLFNFVYDNKDAIVDTVKILGIQYQKQLVTG